MNKQDISEAAKRLQYTNGWTFAYTPVERMAKAKDMIVGLNPGGRDGESYAQIWECSTNEWFENRTNDTPHFTTMKRQVQGWHELLQIDKDTVFSAPFVPFRSPNMDRITNAETIAFSNKLWTWVTGSTAARRFICMGELAAENIGRLLSVGEWEHRPSGVGNVTVGRAITADGRVVARVPHPSWYRFMTLTDLDQRRIAQDAIKWAGAI